MTHTTLATHRAILAQDVRYAFRTLSRARGFAIAVILITALGVGANTAAFAVADFVLFRPLPFPEPQTLVRLCEGPPSGGGWGCNNQLSPANYRDVKEATRSFAQLGVFTRTSVNLVGQGEPLRLSAALVTADVLPLLAVPPLLGRTFDTASAGANDLRTVVLSYGLWTTRLGSDPGVIGRTVSLSGTPHQVIGVMPASFQFPSRDVQLWTPLLLREADFADRSDSYLDGVGRLKKGVSFEQARSELRVLAERPEIRNGNPRRETGFSLFWQRDEMSPRYRTILLALCAASLCMLLLTCANLANLLLARAAARERELAVRAALGAGRERLVRQLLTESVTLALAGGTAGMLLAWALVPLLASLVPSTLPIAGTPSVDLRVLAIAAVLVSLTGLGFGLIPALRQGGRNGLAALREGTRAGGGRKQRLRSALVVLEVAVSVVLLISSGLLVRAMLRVQAVDTGFKADNVLTLRTELPRPKYDSTARRTQFYADVVARVRALPGVRSAAYTSGLPMVMTGGITRVDVPGEEPRNDGSQNVSIRFLTSQYFDALGIPLQRGRDVSETDTPDRGQVAVISQSLAGRHWPNQDPLGRTFKVRGLERTVIGVVGDVRVRGRERRSEPQLYLPASQVPAETGDIYLPKDLVIRFSGSRSALMSAVTGIVGQTDPEQPISDVRMLGDVLTAESSTRVAQLRVLGALAAIALLLAGVGIHGLLAFTVAQRSQEIGVRLALGAEPRSVAGMIIADAARLAALGIVPGALAAYAAARGMSALLFGVPPNDGVTVAVCVSLVFLVTLSGSLLPALRAMHLSPIIAMRSD